MVKRIILLGLSVLLIISSICFSRTKGLVVRGSTGDSIQYCTEYQDSMANDNVVIEFGKIAFLVVLVIQIIFLKKKIPLFEISIYLLVCLFLTGLIFAVQSDGCSIWGTVAYAKNVPLLVYVSAFILFFGYCVVLLVKGILNKIGKKPNLNSGRI